MYFTVDFYNRTAVYIALEHNVFSAGGHICTAAQSYYLEQKPLLVHPFLFASLQNNRNYSAACVQGDLEAGTEGLGMWGQWH